MPETSAIVWQAERTFDCIAPDSSTSLVHAAVGFPKQVGNTEEWKCPYRFEFLGQNHVRQISGANALQSLTCALAILMIEIRSLKEFSRYTITYEGVSDLLYGLPDIRFAAQESVEDGDEMDETRIE